MSNNKLENAKLILESYSGTDAMSVLKDLGCDWIIYKGNPYISNAQLQRIYNIAPGKSHSILQGCARSRTFDPYVASLRPKRDLKASERKTLLVSKGAARAKIWSAVAAIAASLLIETPEAYKVRNLAFDWEAGVHDGRAAVWQLEDSPSVESVTDEDLAKLVIHLSERVKNLERQIAALSSQQPTQLHLNGSEAKIRALLAEAR